MSGLTSGPCPVCQQTAALWNGSTDAKVSIENKESCQHRTLKAVDIRRDFDDWLDDSRLFGNKICLVCRRYYSADTQFCSSDGTVLRDTTVRSRTAPLIDGRLQLTAYLGSGSLTDVYGGTDQATNTGVAVKILRRALSHDNTFVSAFLEEVVRTKALAHPNISSIYYCGILPNGRPYMVTEFLPEYRSLISAVKQAGSINIVRLLNVLISACRALEYAHDKGVLHLYPSASNVTMCSQGTDEELVKVCDFGIAERLFRDLPAEQHASRTMGIFGSPLIICPEYSRGEPATEKSDVYGLGLVVYLALARKPALVRSSALGTVLAHMQDEPEPFDKFLGVPQKLDELVFACLAKQPGQRPGMHELRSRLEEILKEFSR